MDRIARFSLCLALAATGCRKAAPPADLERASTGQGLASAPQPQRCSRVSSAPPFVLGSRDPKAAGETDAGEALDNMLPFATEAGEGVAWSGGFAFGAIHVPKDTPTLAVVTLDREGKDAKVIPIGTARGDADPPRVVARGNELFLGVLERRPNARALRLGRLEQGKLSWGPEFQSQSGESQAFDLAVGGARLVAVWDEEEPERSRIRVAAVDASNLSSATAARSVSPDGTDADSPRLITRPGGFWLAYIARRTATDADAGFVAEEIGFRWIEVIALDSNGSPIGPPRPLSSRDGHVMVFDLAPAPEGGALVVWRDDDTSTGSAGGQIMRSLVRQGPPDSPSVLVDNEVGSGAPNLLQGWLALTAASGSTLLAPLSPVGELLGQPLAEPEIGQGEPLAISDGALLIARPTGRDMRLHVIQCKQQGDAG